MRRVVVLVIAAMVVSGCTFAAIEAEPDRALGPPNKPRIIVLGHVKAADPAWEPYRQHFAQGFAEWFKNNPGVPDALTDPAARFPDEAVILTGTITDIDEGNSALRWLVGMGAGRVQVRGDFEIVDATGQVLTRFKARESYLGGVGIRGPAFLSVEDVVRRLSGTVAKSTRNWANSEPLD